MADRRVDVLIRAAVEDLQPLVKGMRERGWTVEVHVDSSPDDAGFTVSAVTVSAVVTVIPVKFYSEEFKTEHGLDA